MTNFDQEKHKKFISLDINPLSDLEQANNLASNFSEITNEYDLLKLEDISVPYIYTDIATTRPTRPRGPSW